MLLGSFALVAALAAPQAGDVQGESQPPLPPELVVPPAPPRSPEEEHATFRIAEGWRIDLVAAEPLVHDPVAVAFDARGRLWVVEMRGYMHDVDGVGEDLAVGSIAVLEDADGDGRFDRRTVFWDELVLPRAVLPLRDGALVLAPPNLYLCRDTDGDGVSDEETIVDTGLGGIHSPEHAANGLLPGIDGWIHGANHRTRYRVRGARIEKEHVPVAGQWGIAQDDAGRLFFDTNSDALRFHPFASHYAVRNRWLGKAAGADVAVVRDQRVRPARVTPGVNRGYQTGVLVGGRLASFTAACAPLIARGDALPPGARGQAFVCEPAANLVKRWRLVEEGDGLRGIEVEADREAGLEFLTSTDERFRPVNLCDEPGGGFLVVDMYRGVIQHRLFVTSFLRKQVEERGLASPIGLGRIWRVARDDAPPRGVRVDFPSASDEELAALLSHPAGWWRDAAQRWIAEGDAVGASTIVRLLALAREGESSFGRLHALWTLASLGRADAALAASALRDADREVRLAAIRLAEPWLDGPAGSGLVARFVDLARSGDPRARRQAILSLGEARGAAAEQALLDLALEDASTTTLRGAIVSGLAGRELEFLGRVCAVPDNEAPAGSPATSDPARESVAPAGRGDLLELLARCVVRAGDRGRIVRLLGVVGFSRGWRAKALAAGIFAARGIGADGKPVPIPLDREPFAIGADASAVLRDAFTWPGKPGPAPPVIRPLTDDEARRFDQGREIYGKTCAACHQPDGAGLEGKGPPLRGTEWVLGPEERLTRILLQGMTGPVTIDGVEWRMDMPAWPASDTELAAVMTFVRRSFGNAADPVEPAAVAATRARHAGRAQPWTAAELREAR